MLNEAWKKYEASVLKLRTSDEKLTAYKGFIAGWASAYRIFFDMLHNPHPGDNLKFANMATEIQEVVEELKEQVRRKN